MYQTTTTANWSIFQGYTQNFAKDSKKPTAHITKSKSRLKAYGQTVYLKDGSNFEIEVFNPKTISVLAKIKINGTFISEAGLIIKPGQRVFLERFIDDAKKFVFNTYEVENSKEAKAAISENGHIEVIFYDQTVHNYLISNYPSQPVYFNSCNSSGQSPFVGGTTTVSNYANTTFTASNSNPVLGSSSLNSNVEYASMINDSIETGRVEKGQKSSQEFKNSSAEFDYFSCATSNWQILPESKRPIESGEIRTYCTGCGTRTKKSTWKFCPNCGTSTNS